MIDDDDDDDDVDVPLCSLLLLQVVLEWIKQGPKHRTSQVIFSSTGGRKFRDILLINHL